VGATVSGHAVIQPRTTPPRPEVEYFLDCAQEAEELDACTAMTLRLYGDDEAMVRVMAYEAGDDFRKRQQKCLRLAAMADDVLPLLAPERRAGLVHHGLRFISWSATGMAECFSGWAINDATEGGCMLPFRPVPRSRAGVPFKRTMRRLQSPKFIRRYVRRQFDSLAHLRQLCSINLRRAAATGVPIVADAAIWREWQAQRRDIRDRQDRAFGAMTQRSIQGRLRRDRRMVLRSWRMAVSTLGAEAVSAFLRGESLKLVGTEVILTLRKRGSVADRGHGCLSVGLLARDGTRLADLCTFVENTPMLDQVSAFALWIMAGEERSIVECANLIDIAPIAINHPLLLHHQKTRSERFEAAMRDIDPAMAERIAAIMSRSHRPHQRQLSFDDERARNEAYWEQTKGHWIEAVLTQVVGCRSFRVLQAAQVL
jgi:hypothetical protein